jgi:hypothetical protein
MADIETSPFTRPSQEPLASGVPPPAMRRQSSNRSANGGGYGAGGELSAALGDWRESLEGMLPEQHSSGEEAPGGVCHQVFNSVIYGSE